MKGKLKLGDIINSIKEYFTVLFNQYLAPKPKSHIIPLFFLGLFYLIAIITSLLSDKLFYLINFAYIGTALAIGVFLSTSLKKAYAGWGRRITQLLVGLYMFFFIGIWLNDNIQIEGFFLYLFSGIFTGAVLHYIIAKIVGPLIFNRGWCGWACWTAMILDLLPWKENARGRKKGLGFLRYVSFFLSLLMAIFLYFLLDLKAYHLEKTAMIFFFVGNIIYYVVGILMAWVLKDNRAFCKYLCPITVLMKIFSRFSLIKVFISKRKCTECGLCEKKCPMNIKLLDYKKAGKRILSTECILCCTCIDVCPENALNMSFKYDYGLQEYLIYKKENKSHKQSI